MRVRRWIGRWRVEERSGSLVVGRRGLDGRHRTVFDGQIGIRGHRALQCRGERGGAGKDEGPSVREG